MTSTPAWPVAIIGSGNIGTDLMLKILRGSTTRDAWVRWSASTRLRRACPRDTAGHPDDADGVDGLLALPNFDDIRLVFDATAARRAPRELGRAANPPVCACSISPRLDRPVLRAGGQSGRPPRRAEPEHGHLRRAGHGADRRRRRPGRVRCLRRDRLLDFREVRRPGDARQHRRVHRDHRTGRAGASAARSEARP